MILEKSPSRVNSYLRVPGNVWTTQKSEGATDLSPRAIDTADQYDNWQRSVHACCIRYEINRPHNKQHPCGSGWDQRNIFKVGKHGKHLVDSGAWSVILASVYSILTIKMNLLSFSKLDEQGVSTKIEGKQCRLVGRGDSCKLVERMRKRPSDGLFVAQKMQAIS